MNRKDFRPTNDKSATISDKDRKIIKENKKYKNLDSASRSGKDFTETKETKFVPVKYDKKTGKYIQDKNKKVTTETKVTEYKHPKKEDKPKMEKYLRGSTEKEIEDYEIRELRKINYENALKNIQNPPKKPWWMTQHEYDREKAMDREVARAKGKKAYIETTGEDTK